MTIHEVFNEQANHCRNLDSPFMGRLLDLIADRITPGRPVTDRVLTWTGDASAAGDNVPLRLAGALHALKLGDIALTEVYPPNTVSDDDLWLAISDSFDTYENHILTWLKRPPQTNEVRRAAVLLPALAHVHQRIGLPVDLIELGTSGGLNLRADQFRVDLPNSVLGKEKSAVRLEPAWSGCLPPTKLPEITSRSGVDLTPIDPNTNEGRLRLLSYLWPDQPDRLHRTAAAIDIAREIPATLHQADAADWLELALKAPKTDHLNIVFHTVAWQYFPENTRRKAEAVFDTMRSNQRLVRIAMEHDGGHGASVEITWPDGAISKVARADFHGRWVNWIEA